MKEQKSLLKQKPMINKKKVDENNPINKGATKGYAVKDRAKMFEN